MYINTNTSHTYVNIHTYIYIYVSLYMRVYIYTHTISLSLSGPRGGQTRFEKHALKQLAARGKAGPPRWSVGADTAMLE